MNAPIVLVASIATALLAGSQASAKTPHRTQRQNVATSCTTAGSPSFVGVKTVSNVAGGANAAVLGGEQNEACDKYDAIAGGDTNDIGSNGNAFGAFIGAGFENEVAAPFSFIGAGANHQISGVGESFIGAGQSNTITSGEAAVVSGFYNVVSGNGSFVGSGGAEVQDLYNESSPTIPQNNVVSGQDSFVGAGDLNRVSGNGSFIGGGGYTKAATGSEAAGNQISGTDAFIGAGDLNSISASQGFVGAGNANVIGAAGVAAVIAGGTTNGATGSEATVGGGYGNTVSGNYGTIFGGYTSSVTGELSLAAGYHADASHNGTFVWSDYVSGSTAIKDTANGQFLVRASGGVTIYSNEAATAGVKLAAGSGTWSSLSDRNAKMAERPLDNDATLAALSKLSIERWRYRSEPGVSHVGPMAQDFYAAFALGEDSRHITSIDEEGVAIAAIGTLDRSTTALYAEHVRLRAESDRLRASFVRLHNVASSTFAAADALRDDARAALANRARLIRTHERLLAAYDELRTRAALRGPTK